MPISREWDLRDKLTANGPWFNHSVSEQRRRAEVKKVAE